MGALWSFHGQTAYVCTSVTDVHTYMLQILFSSDWTVLSLVVSSYLYGKRPYSVYGQLMDLIKQILFPIDLAGKNADFVTDIMTTKQTLFSP